MAENLPKAFSAEIRIREDDEHLPPSGVAFAATDIEPGVVYEKGGVKVTAIEVNHDDKIKPAFGYVIEDARDRRAFDVVRDLGNSEGPGRVRSADNAVESELRDADRC